MRQRHVCRFHSGSAHKCRSAERPDRRAGRKVGAERFKPPSQPPEGGRAATQFGRARLDAKGEEPETLMGMLRAIIRPRGQSSTPAPSASPAISPSVDHAILLVLHRYSAIQAGAD